MEKSQKDKRGIFFVDNSACIESEKMERKGNPMLIDTPEGFANWQVAFCQNENDNEACKK